jgi:ParB-like chromosome segregation protein Spo0J
MTHPHLGYIPLTSLWPYHRNARTHSKKQFRQIANSIARFGFTNSILVSDDNEIIAGHDRFAAAALRKIGNIPILRLSHLNDVGMTVAAPFRFISSRLKLES